jgi:hypothetical protein
VLLEHDHLLALPRKHRRTAEPAHSRADHDTIYRLALQRRRELRSAEPLSAHVVVDVHEGALVRGTTTAARARWAPQRRLTRQPAAELPNQGTAASDDEHAEQARACCTVVRESEQGSNADQCRHGDFTHC